MQKKCTTGVYRESGEVIFGFQTRMLLFKVTQSDGNRTVGILCHVNDTPSYPNYVISGMSVSSAWKLWNQGSSYLYIGWHFILRQSNTIDISAECVRKASKEMAIFRSITTISTDPPQCVVVLTKIVKDLSYLSLVWKLTYAFFIVKQRWFNLVASYFRCHAYDAVLLCTFVTV